MIHLPIHDAWRCDTERPHCAACRGSRAFRDDAAKFYALPGSKLDWYCEIIGKPVEGVPTDDPAPPPTARAARSAPATPAVPLTPEQHARARHAATFGAMAQAAFTAAGGQGACAGCGDSTYGALAAKWLANPDLDQIEPDIRRWLTAKVPTITLGDWLFKARPAMRGAHTAAPPPIYDPRPGGPGAKLADVIKEVTGLDHRECPRCNARVKQLDDWGWVASAFHVAMVARWLRAEAKERNIPIRPGLIARALRAALRGKGGVQSKP